MSNIPLTDSTLIPLKQKPRFLHLFISNDIVSTKIYDKRGDFDFEIAK